MNTEKSINISFKWSMITEIAVKLITPVLNAVLARILLPEDFAPLATISMLMSFCEVFIESGFKKYLIQHKFNNQKEFQESMDVAFWTNLIIAASIWMLIIVFAKPLARFLGSPKIYRAISISGAMLPLYGIVGIFSARLQKELQFKKLFGVRIITSLIPLFVTVPLALLGFNYWALVIGNVTSIFVQMVVIIIISGHRVHFFFSVKILKKMYSYGIWTLFDGFAIWLTNWIDSLIIAKYMDDYYLGIYKNSLSTVTALFSIVTASIIPVLFVGLTKYQDNDKTFSTFFTLVQRRLMLILFPLGVGVSIYSDFAVDILFGANWHDANQIIGIIAITTALRTIFVSICSDAYRAKGKFKIPLILQIVDLCTLVPTCIISAQMGFWYLVYARALHKLLLIIPEIIIMQKLLKIDMKKQMIKCIPICTSVGLMVCFCIMMRKINDSFIWNTISILLSAGIYSVCLLIFPSTRNELVDLLHLKGIKY